MTNAPASNQRPAVIVVGSGFGGAVCAARLAEAGHSVTLLERGPWRDTVPVRSMGIQRRTPFPRGGKLFTRSLWGIGGNWLPGRARLNKRGLYELFFGSGTRVVCSSGVGGGSHVYSASHVRPLVAHYWEGHHPDISDALMAPHYDAVLERMGSVTPTPELGIPNTSAARFRDSEHLEAGKPPPNPRLGYLLPKDPANPQRVVDARGIERCEVDYEANDEGFLGSPGGGKTTLDVAYLAPALQLGLDVKDLCEVRAIHRQHYGAARYRVEYLDHGTGKRAALEADHVILAAGTLNTLRILLHSREIAGLAGMPQLGRRYGTNGDYLGFWDYNDPNVDQTRGLPTTGGVKLRGDTDPPMIGGGGFPSVDSYPLPRRMRARIKRAAFIAGLGEDVMNGVVRMKGGRLQISYAWEESPIFARTRAMFDEIRRRTGRRIYAPRVPITVHPTGGACLGRDRDHGVVGANGEIFDNPGLYVADAAALPRSPGGPPSITIAAWAEHIAKGFGTRAR